MPYHRTLGAEVTARAVLGPIAGTGANQNGVWVDRQGFYSALAVALASTSGGVTGGTVKIQFRDAADAAGTGAADFGSPATVTIAAGPNAQAIAQLSIDLSGARRYVSFGIDSDPTGGTPASIVSGILVLGNSDRSLVA